MAAEQHELGEGAEYRQEQGVLLRQRAGDGDHAKGRAQPQEPRPGGGKRSAQPEIGPEPEDHRGRGEHLHPLDHVEHRAHLARGEQPGGDREPLEGLGPLVRWRKRGPQAAEHEQEQKADDEVQDQVAELERAGLEAAGQPHLEREARHRERATGGARRAGTERLHGTPARGDFLKDPGLDEVRKIVEDEAARESGPVEQDRDQRGDAEDCPGQPPLHGQWVGISHWTLPAVRRHRPFGWKEGTA
ncbi:MAG: hypothetical protein RML12_03375 [Xanthomonadales bacterium]|nr:hypothetical protein [Xanthomonadales bacterium]